MAAHRSRDYGRRSFAGEKGRMRYLITGGAGFIGCNDAATFKSLGHAVLAVDNFSRVGSRANAEWLLAEHRVKTSNVDVRDAAALEKAVSEYGPDVVLHCAAQVAVTTSV